MNTTIYKYDITHEPGSDRKKVSMPVGAKIIHVDTQDAGVQAWAMVNPEAPFEAVTFVVVGTGHKLPDERIEHVGTTLHYGGSLVLHWFKVLK